jgi:hypothetical protein
MRGSIPFNYGTHLEGVIYGVAAFCKLDNMVCADTTIDQYLLSVEGIGLLCPIKMLAKPSREKDTIA